jgi:uncharacterized membrane protein
VARGKIGWRVGLGTRGEVEDFLHTITLISIPNNNTGIMLLEHLIYSTAIAIIAGMIHFKRTGRDYSWIIIASAYAPDLDHLAGYIFKQFDIAVLINGIPLKHGDFHNIAVLLIFAGIVGLILKTTGMKFRDSFMFAGIGFSANIFEDVLVYNPGYAFLWPLSTQVFGIGIVEYEPDLYGIANTEVLIAGIIAVMVCMTIRTIYKDDFNINKIIKPYIAAFIISNLTLSALGFYHFDLIEEGRRSDIVDNWQFTRNASWDSTVSHNSTISHNGGHSAKIEISGNKDKISGLWRSKNIPVKQDTNYTFSAWGKIEGAGGNFSPAVRVVELNASGKQIRQTNLDFGKGTHDWVQKQKVFKTHRNTTLVHVYGNIWKGYGTFWFDDVELYEEGTDRNIIANNGFEIGIRHIINFII